MKCILCVCACLCALVCYADFSKTATATEFLLINCHALENFFVFVDLGLKISE